MVHMKVNGKLLVGIAGGSPTKPTEVALLEANGVEGLLSSQPSDWKALRKSSNMQVTPSCRVNMLTEVTCPCMSHRLDHTAHFRRKPTVQLCSNVANCRVALSSWAYA